MKYFKLKRCRKCNLIYCSVLDSDCPVCRCSVRYGVVEYNMVRYVRMDWSGLRQGMVRFGIKIRDNNII